MEYLPTNRLTWNRLWFAHDGDVSARSTGLFTRLASAVATKLRP